MNVIGKLRVQFLGGGRNIGTGALEHSSISAPNKPVKEHEITSMVCVCVSNGKF